MKYLLDFVSCYGSSSWRRRSTAEEEEASSSCEARRKRAVSRAAAAAASQWKPNLSSICEDNVLHRIKNINNNKNLGRSDETTTAILKRTNSSSTSSAPPHHYHDTLSGRAPIATMMPALAPTPFFF